MKTITTTGARLVEDVRLLFPCPVHICDGRGVIWNFWTGKDEKCPHVKDPFAAEPIIPN